MKGLICRFPSPFIKYRRPINQDICFWRRDYWQLLKHQDSIRILRIEPARIRNRFDTNSNRKWPIRFDSITNRTYEYSKFVDSTAALVDFGSRRAKFCTLFSARLLMTPAFKIAFIILSYCNKHFDIAGHPAWGKIWFVEHWKFELEDSEEHGDADSFAKESIRKYLVTHINTNNRGSPRSTDTPVRKYPPSYILYKVKAKWPTKLFLVKSAWP